MPTGYTYDVQTGKITDFKSFALLCARGMGALITMRDEPLDAPIREFEPSSHYADRLKEIEADLVRLRAMTPSQATVAAEQDYKERLSRKKKWEAERVEQRTRYETMLSKVDAWTPPSPDHVGLKSFMQQQLRESIEFDCDPEYRETVEPQSGSDWLKGNVERAEKNLAYYRAEHQKERERVAARNIWVSALKSSLPAAP